ncbi:hypothetical protein KXS11_17595 [Plantibacter flavus]|uniref:hypothetical protein n=1 Tax=Plantibacter flavus TaxID=150123 RepID=UPI003F18E47C
MAQEAATRVIGGGIVGLGDFMTDMLANAFIGSRPAESSWEVADGQFWFWIATMGLVTAIVALFQIAPAVVLRDGRRIGQIAAGLVVAVPASVAGVYVMQQFVVLGGETTDALVATVQDQSLGTALLRMFGYTTVAGETIANEDGGIVEALRPATNAVPSTIIGQYVIVLLILGIMAIAALFLYVSMAIRSFGLVALAATGPVGLMMVGQPKFAVWATRWANLTIGLIIAEPLAAAILVLTIRLTARSTNVGVMIVSAGIVFAAAFAPLWAVRLVSFAGDEVKHSLQARPHPSARAQSAVRVVGKRSSVGSVATAVAAIAAQFDR